MDDSMVEKIISSDPLYFDNIYAKIDPNVRLDKEQLAAVISEDKYSLVIAGAGAGKTTTVAARVKYLVDKKNVDPQTILVLSFTRKAVEELRQRINTDLDIAANITTFHSLGYKYICKHNKDTKCLVAADPNFLKKTFSDFFREKIYTSPNNLEKFMNCFNAKVIDPVRNREPYGQFLREHFRDFQNFDEYFNAYIEHSLNSTQSEKIEKVIDNEAERRVLYDIPTTLKGEQVKSAAEARIANFLYRNGIDYSYEEVYDELVGDYQPYKPDFTVYSGGRKIYIEFFGLSDDDSMSSREYQKQRKIKEDFHRKNKNLFVGLENKPNQGYIGTLVKYLKEKGVELHPENAKRIYRTYLTNNPTREFFKVQSFFVNCVNQIKQSHKYGDNLETYIHQYISSTMADYDQTIAEQQFHYIYDFFIFYENKLHSRKDVQYFDFHDLLYFGQKFADSEHKYTHIIIDEYQDISFERFALAKTILNSTNASLMAVGDDWQTIFSFAGSRIDYIIQFEKYFKGAKIYYLINTYRNAQELINCTGEFIMRNDMQIKKQLNSPKNIQLPFRKITYKDTPRLIRKLYCDIIKLHHDKPNDRILILGRTNGAINSLSQYIGASRFFKKGTNTELKLTSPGNLICFFDDETLRDLAMWYDSSFSVQTMTIHKSKGLTTDHTYIIGLERSFPSEHPDFWLNIALQDETIKEPIEFAEERRIFYVALTRTKNEVVLCLNEDPKKISPFVTELKQILKDQK